MSKKILLISAVILALTVMLTACKGKNKTDGPSAENTDKVVQTVTVTNKDGEVTNVEIFEDTSGDKYITNVDGDKIPLTTDKDGFNDDIGYLVTSKPAPTSAPSNTVNPTNDNTSSSNTKPSASESEKSSTTESTTESENPTGGGIIIDSTVGQDRISWDDIKNPKK